MKHIMAILLLFALSPLLHAQQDQAPEALNLDAVQKSIGYPVDATAAGIEGKVTARVTVDEKGNVIASEIIESPSALLSEAVTKKIDNLKFSPAKIKGKAVKSKVEVPFIFELPESMTRKGDSDLPPFTSLEKALADPLSVVELDLSGQNLDGLDPRAASLKNLIKINLDGNNFTKFPSVLSKLPLLEEISIADNQLSSVPGWVKKIPNLHFLDLRGNEISKGTAMKIRETLEEVDELLLD